MKIEIDEDIIRSIRRISAKVNGALGGSTKAKNREARLKRVSRKSRLISSRAA